MSIRNTIALFIKEIVIQSKNEPKAKTNILYSVFHLWLARRFFKNHVVVLTQPNYLPIKRTLFWLSTLILYRYQVSSYSRRNGCWLAFFCSVPKKFRQYFFHTLTFCFLFFIPCILFLVSCNLVLASCNLFPATCFLILHKLSLYNATAINIIGKCGEWICKAAGHRQENRFANGAAFVETGCWDRRKF